MPSPITENVWEAAAEEKYWRETAETARRGQDMMEQKAGGKISGFYVLCLSELDAAVHFTRPECLASRAAFVDN